MEDIREIDPALPPTLDRTVCLQQVDPAHELLEPAHAQPGHQPAGLLGHEEEQVDDVLGLAPESLSELGILVRDPDRTGVQVAGPHHHAAGRDQRRRREAHLVGAEQRRDHDVAARLQLAVRLHPDARPEIVQHEGLLRLRSPISHGIPAWKIEDTGEAPVPPSWPEINTWSAPAFATPAATVPTPTSATSFTEIRAEGLLQRRS